MSGGLARTLGPVLGIVLAITGCSGDIGVENQVEIPYVARDDAWFVSDGPVRLESPLSGAPLLATGFEDGALVMDALGLLRVTSDGSSERLVEWDAPVVGGELAPGENSVVISAVTPALGGLQEQTRFFRVGDTVTEVLDSPGNLPLVGVLADGILVRDRLGRSTLSFISDAGRVVSMGLDVTDAVLIPGTRTIVVQDDSAGSLRVVDIDTAAELEVEGLPQHAVFSQVVAPVGGSILAFAIHPEGPDSQPELWTLSSDPLRVTPFGALDPADVVGGFTGDNESVVVLRGGDTPEAVDVETGQVHSVELDPLATPLEWSRPSLTLVGLRARFTD